MLFGKVRTSCPICGDVEVRGPEITILARVEESHNVYAFECSKCSSPIVKEAAGAIVAMLLRAGAQVGAWPPPARLEPGPITYNDLIDFHEKIDRLPTAER